ncbi:unnamed protein product [Linum tenue]|uniref:Uncharacterized protein n=1 Tax=Linum tenue TaxID=586396 RepID=A0AAV0KQ76_9ROSI|nr:unnamed protein product [Linum tenue]
MIVCKVANQRSSSPVLHEALLKGIRGNVIPPGELWKSRDRRGQPCNTMSTLTSSISE